MNGLRLYIKPISANGVVGKKVFYSRRAGGPYYRWFFEEKLGRWQGLRMHACDLTLGELSLACWKAVPLALQVRLNEHYME
ncbi:MAG TPA: hypothetical protein VJ124_02380 [Pyrinomonadaceae bacterium]|nr:hypothetical protein [Pyrinomonadaceae bacterium]